MSYCLCEWNLGWPSFQSIIILAPAFSYVVLHLQLHSQWISSFGCLKNQICIISSNNLVIIWWWLKYQCVAKWHGKQSKIISFSFGFQMPVCRIAKIKIGAYIECVLVIFFTKLNAAYLVGFWAVVSLVNAESFYVKQELSIGCRSCSSIFQG